MEGFHEGKDKEKNTGREAEIKRLREELAEAMEQMEDEFSLERIDKLTAKLESLEGAEREFDVKQAKTEFFQKYYPLTEEWEEQNRQRTHKGRQRGQSGLGRKMKAAIVLAAVFLCLNGATVAIAGMNLFEAIFRWDEETFQIGTAEGNVEIPAREDKTMLFSEEGTAWAELEADFGAEIPTIGAFADMEITEMESDVEGYAFIAFSDGEQEYHYDAKNLERRGGTTVVEKTEEEPIEYNLNGITYYFVQNRRWAVIVWQYENQIYTLSGDFEIEQAETIIKSIQYKEE